MNALTQKMIDDYKPYLKPEWWRVLKAHAEQDDAKGRGIVNILKVYSADGKYLLEKIYQMAHHVGSETGYRVLDNLRAGVESLPE